MTPASKNDILDVTLIVEVFETILTHIFATFFTIIDRAFIISPSGKQVDFVGAHTALSSWCLF